MLVVELFHYHLRNENLLVDENRTFFTDIYIKKYQIQWKSICNIFKVKLFKNNSLNVYVWIKKKFFLCDPIYNTFNRSVRADETSYMTSARTVMMQPGTLMANVVHEEERAKHASCTTRLLKYGPSVYRVSRIFCTFVFGSAFLVKSSEEFIPLIISRHYLISNYYFSNTKIIHKTDNIFHYSNIQ